MVSLNPLKAGNSTKAGNSQIPTYLLRDSYKKAENPTKAGNSTMKNVVQHEFGKSFGSCPANILSTYTGSSSVGISGLTSTPLFNFWGGGCCPGSYFAMTNALWTQAAIYPKTTRTQDNCGAILTASNSLNESDILDAGWKNLLGGLFGLSVVG